MNLNDSVRVGNKTTQMLNAKRAKRYTQITFFLKYFSEDGQKYKIGDKSTYYFPK
jgi:hypothetical protein